jgi:hypothetical protein
MEPEFPREVKLVLKMELKLSLAKVNDLKILLNVLDPVKYNFFLSSAPLRKNSNISTNPKSPVSNKPKDSTVSLVDPAAVAEEKNLKQKETPTQNNKNLATFAQVPEDTRSQYIE